MPGFAAPSGKPLPPLQVRIAPVQAGITSDQIKPGDIVELRVSALSMVDAQELRIKVELVGGAKLISGDTSWNGPAAKNEEKAITLTVQAPMTGKGRIKVSVSSPPADGTRFSGGAEYVLGPNVKMKPEKEYPLKKDSKGRDVIEYRQ